MDKETEERISRPYSFQEYPKMKYHPDGRTATVADDAAESALGGEWMPNPTEAAKMRAERDAADEKRAAAQIASAQAPKGKA
jgi:hypothetical protein